MKIIQSEIILETSSLDSLEMLEFVKTLKLREISLLVLYSKDGFKTTDLELCALVKKASIINFVNQL